MNTNEGKKKFPRFLKYLVIDIVIAAVVSFVLITYVASAYRIEGHSMQNTLYDHERIIVLKLGIKTSNIHRSDIIVLRKPIDPRKSIIKRVIGLPGETIEIKRGTVYIDGVKLEEPYIRKKPDVMLFYFSMKPVKLSPGYYFVMGDNRALSMDSRYFGPIPFEYIYGKMLFRYWPLSKLGKTR